jgi:BlaR1 peptidase M56
MMLELLAESALRSVFLGGGVWLCLALLRVRSPKLQMTAWTMVLAASLAMPAMTPWLRITLPADPPRGRLVKIVWTNASLLAAPPEGRTAPAGEKFTPAGRQKESATDHADAAAAASRDIPAQPPDLAYLVPLDWHALAFAAYACISGAMMLRLAFGWLVMWRIVRAARPVGDGWAAGADVRVSSVVRVPVTFASTILLPSNYAAWSARKLRAVMLHEGSHATHGDSYVLLLAAINRAVFWFNPFAWWLVTHLADLAEMISDDDAIVGLNDDRDHYADTLLDVARDAHPLPSGLAMARPGTLRRRVTRIVSMTAAPQRIRAQARLMMAAAILPLACLSAITFARAGVPAAATAIQPIAGRPTGTASLDRYVGRFAIGPTVLTITRDGEQLFVQLSGQPKLRLMPVNGQEFVDERGDSHLTFVLKDERGATAVMLRAGTTTKQGERIGDAKADEMEAAFQERMAGLAQRFINQAPAPGAKAALLQMIDGLRHDPPSYERMSPQLADKMRRQLPELQSMLEALGPAEQAFFRGVASIGPDIYVVKFANGTGEFRIELAADGTIVEANGHPDGDGTPGGIEGCAVEPMLKASDHTPPIRLTFTNLSGGNVRLFSLDSGGERRAFGELAGNRSKEVLTAVGRPLVVADDAGQCREIVLPGQYTRYHLIERSGSLSGTPRNTPAAGSEEALQQYLDGVRRGLPDYDRLTPEAAALTRHFLSQQRAILTGLGALRAISFGNVGSIGGDIFRLRFANGSANGQITLAEDGRIQHVWLNP